MILNTLRLVNYKQYAALSLDFREGLVGIIGKNGAGKSTIFEAILYCLFGRDESNKSLVRSAFADGKANVELTLDFTIGETLYRVKREFRGKALAVGAEFYKNDQLVAKGVSAVNDELAKVLHMERDAFKRSVFSGQKELSELSDSSGEARKRMVRRMLGLDTLDDIQTRVNADIRDLSSQMTGQRQNLLSEETLKSLQENITTQSKTLKKQQTELKKESDNLRASEKRYAAEKHKFEAEEQRLQRYNALQQALGQMQERLTGLTTQQENLQQKSRDLQQQQARQDGLRSEFATYESDKKALETLEKEQQRHINKEARSLRIAEDQEKITAQKKKLAELDRALLQLPLVSVSLDEKERIIANLEAEMEAKRTELRGFDAQIAEYKSRIQERSEKVASLRALGKEGQCPTCLQPLLEGYERALSELNSEINTLQTNELHKFDTAKKTVTEAGLALKTQLQAVRAEVETLIKEQSRLLELNRQQQTESIQLQQWEAKLVADSAILREIGEVRFDEAAYKTLRNKLSEMEPRYREFLSNENYLRRERPAVETALQNTAKGIVETQGQMTARQAEIDALAHDPVQYQAAKQALTDFSEVFNAQSAAVRTLHRTVLELENEIARNQEKIAANNQILAHISGKLEETDLLRKLAEMLNLFKTEILEKVSPGISREASDLFSRITKGKYESIRVDENFDFAIADGGIFYPIHRFSGGEVDLANFCLRIAITKAIMDLSGSEQRIEFLAFDEIFGSQDEERRFEMMLALNYLQEQFRQIYIVSHIESLKDYFPHLLEIQSAPEGSSAKWI
ncbi:MAG TPA: SMC family ATPase [Saprospiraceae bacterium]|nr:SMC family ATPase [Saprospiraceae bacterium]HPI08471.1 SMC family ATPase [Saprospiraceae bacterium]